MWSEHAFLLSVDPEVRVMGQEFLISAAAVPVLLDRCQAENVLILGFDGFKVTPEGHRQPQMEHIFATSGSQEGLSEDPISRAITEVRWYFQTHFPAGTDLCFSFVLEPGL